MSATVDIGAARVYVVADMTDWDSAIKQGINAANGFSTQAQSAFDKTEGSVRRAAARLLDLSRNVNVTQQQMEQYVRVASRAGVASDITKAAISGWEQLQQKVRAASDEMRAASDAFDAATKIEAARNSLEQYANSLGKTTSELRVLTAAQEAGVDQGFIDTQIAKIKEYEAATAQAAIEQRQLNAAFDEATSINAATDALDRYVANLGQVSTLTPELARAAAAGVDDDRISRAADAVEKYKAEIAAAEQEQRQFNAAFDDATKIDAARTSLEQYANSLSMTVNERRALSAAEAGVDAGFINEQIAKIKQYELGLEMASDEQRKFNALESEAFAENAAIDRHIAQLKNLTQTTGDYYELLKLKNAQLGISATADPLVDQIKARNQAMGAGTISAKQYEFAMRGLPAQFTDIFTSLAAGQNPLMVFLQQGGQIKDMFGGVEAAARAMGGAVLKMINPITIATVVVIGLAAAAYKASRDLEELAISAAKGSGIAGNADQLYALSEALNRLDNVSLSSAQAAVSKLAEAGRLSGENFRLAAEASARWATITGEGAEEIAAKFNAIASDPMAAILDGTVKLTEAQYLSVAALLEQGDKQEAVNVVTKIYYDMVNDNSASVEAHLSGVSSLWIAIKDNTSGAIREFGNYVNGFAQFAADYDKAFKRLTASGQSGFTAQFSALFDTGVEAQARANAATADALRQNGGSGATNKLTVDQIKANQELQRAWDASGTKAEKLQTKVDKLNASLRNATDEALKNAKVTRNADGTFSGEGYDRLVKALEPKERKTGGHQGRQQDPTRSIRAWQQAELEAIKSQNQQVEWQYQDRELTISAYYDKVTELAVREHDIVVKSIADQIAALTGMKNSQEKIESLKEQARQEDEKFAQRKAQIDRDELIANRQRIQQMEEYAQALQLQNASVTQNLTFAAARLGMGKREAEIAAEVLDVMKRQADGEREIADAVKYRGMNETDAAEKRAILYAATLDGLKAIKEGYALLAQAEGNWLNGVRSAFADYIEQASDVAGQTRDIWNEAFGTMEDAIVDGLSGNLGKWEDYLENLHQMILRFIVKQELAKLAAKFMPGQDAEGGNADKLLQAGTTLAASALPLSGAAAALGVSAAAMMAAATAMALATGASGGASEIGSMFGAIGGLAGIGFAKGGVPGGSGLAAYRNQLVSKPTIFPYAKGGVPNVGLMGEAGTEGIFPLARTSTGDLGVRVVGGNTRGDTYIQQDFHIQGTMDRTTRTQHAKDVGRETGRAMSRS